MSLSLVQFHNSDLKVNATEPRSERMKKKQDQNWFKSYYVTNEVE